MSFPPSLTTRTVHGRFVTYPDGVPACGEVRVVLDDFMQGPTDDTFVAPFDITVPFNRDSNGEVVLVLPANNDPQWTPTTYRVIVKTEQKVLRRRIVVPYEQTGVIDLTDLLRIPTPTPGQAYVLAASKGVAGGVATLGSDGKVPSSQLPTSSGGGSGSIAYVWDGTGYVLSNSSVYVGPVDPLTLDTPPNDGSFWYITDETVEDPGSGGGGSVITTGQRVTASGQVGYTGSAHGLSRTLNVGDAIPSELTGCVWDDTVLRVNAGNDDLVINNWHINAGIDCYASDLTVTNCVITPGAGTAFYGVLGRTGSLTVRDTTIDGAGTSAEQGQGISLDSGGVLTVIRCDISGFQDSIGIQNGLISQVYVHDIALAGSFHSDGIQIFGGGTTGTVVEHSLINITGPAGASTDGEHQNACVYTDLPSGPTVGVTINNCQLNGGGYEVMLSAAPQDVHITNCNFGPVDSSAYGEITASEGTQIAEWSNNHNSSGTLMPNPMA